MLTLPFYMQTFKHVNVSTLKEVTAGSFDLLTSLVEMFKNQAPKFHDQLQEHLNNHEFTLLAKLAHKIKGSLSTLGITELATKMKTLERVAKTNNIENNAQELINEYKQVSQEAIVELDEIHEIFKNSMI